MIGPKDIIQTLAEELRADLESIGMVFVGPIQRGARWANFTARVTDGKAARTYTINIEEEGYRGHREDGA